MIAEISAIIAGVNAATSAIKSVAESTNDIQSIAGFVSSLGSAQVQLQRAQNEGKLSEKDVIAAALAKKQIDETMKEIKDLFTVSGNGHLYSECMQQMADARKAEQLRLAREAARKKAFWKQAREYAIAAFFILIFLPLALAGLLAYLTRR